MIGIAFAADASSQMPQPPLQRNHGANGCSSPQMGQTDFREKLSRYGIDATVPRPVARFAFGRNVASMRAQISDYPNTILPRDVGNPRAANTSSLDGETNKLVV
jgi:hypothetical protein